MILCVAALIAGAAFPLSAPVTAHARSLPVLTLTYGDREFVYSESADPPADFTVAEELARRGMDKPPRERMGIVDGMIARGVGTEEALTYCFPRLPEVLDAAGAAVALEPKDAEMRFYPDRTPMFEISRSSPGVRLDRERTCENVYFALRRGAGSAALAVETLSPERTAEDLSAYTHLRAAYETDFSSSTPERRHNVRLALTRVGGVMLDDGETFSFNETVGRRTRANGFESAKIIVGGRYTEGVGGGVCQASTAVYNCALRAGLKITAVSRHSLVPTYVPPSFDAMVNGSGSDLKFVNDTGGPVSIRTVVSDGHARVEIWSSRMTYTVECRSVTLSVGERPADEEFIDTDRVYTAGMSSGERVRVSGGAAPVKSEGWLIVRRSDGTREAKRIRTDEYAAARGLVAVAP